MASLRGGSLAVIGGIVGTLAVGLFVGGCSGDDNGGNEGGSDGNADVAPDVASNRDTGGPDNTNADGPPADTGRDVTPDGGTDATADARDSGPEGNAGDADGSPSDGSDAASDSDAKYIPPGLLDYPGNYATAICTGFANCCGAGFDRTHCERDFRTVGVDSTLPDLEIYDAGNLTFDPNQAMTCINALQAWPCGAMTAAAHQTILTACTGVLGGTIPIGGTGCQSPLECVSGAYCNGSTCTALQTSGGSCTSDWACSYAGTKTPAFYCNFYPGDGGTPSSGTCAAPQADGTSSFCGNGNISSDFACTNHLCGDNNTCATTATNPADPVNGLCPLYADAGGGG